MVTPRQLAVAIPACDTHDQAGTHEGVGTVTFELAWDLSGVTWTGDGEAQLETELGYQVTLTRGYLTSYSVQLVACEDDEASVATPTASRGWLADLLGSGVAYAGHSYDSENPMAWEQPLVESLTAPADRVMGEVDSTGLSYCGVHYLAARADDDAVDMPGDADMQRVTLVLDGRWSHGEANGQFSLTSGLANGVLHDLLADEEPPLADGRLDTSVSGARVVTGQLARAQVLAGAGGVALLVGFVHA